MNDLEQIIRSGRETKTLDYKGPSSWDEKDKKACCELVKDILAMANTGGGYIVVGVAESAAGFDFLGLSDDQLKSFDPSRISRFVQNYADPPISCEVAKVTSHARTFAVIEVAGFSDTPHICQKDFEGVLRATALYVRTDNSESAPIKSSADFRRIVEAAVRNKQDQLLQSFRAILVGTAKAHAADQSTTQFREELNRSRARAATANAYQKTADEKPYRGFRETWSFPAHFDRERLGIAALRQAVQNAKVEYLGWPFLPCDPFEGRRPGVMDDGYEAHYAFEDWGDNARRIYWHLGYSGLIHQQILMAEESVTSVVDIERLLPLRDIAKPRPTKFFLKLKAACSIALLDKLLRAPSPTSPLLVLKQHRASLAGSVLP